MVKILLTGIGGDVSQSVATIIRESKRAYELVGSDVDYDHGGSYFVDKTFLLPPSTDPNYLNQFQQLVREERIDIAIPLTEPELIHLHPWIPQASHISWIWSGPTVCASGLDKLKTAEHLASLDIPVPWTTYTRETLPKEYPCIMKPRIGSGSKSILIVKNKEEALYLRNHYSDFVFQELLEPSDKEVTCAVYRTREGQTAVFQMLRRLKGGITAWAKIINEPDVTRICQEIAEKLDLRGSMNVQMRLTQDGPRIFEINPRYSSTSLMRHRVGFCDVLWALDEIEGKKIHFPNIPVGKILVRIHGAATLQKSRVEIPTYKQEQIGTKESIEKKNTKLNSHNEWDKLQEVILGSVDEMSAGFDFPCNIKPELIDQATTISQEVYPKWYLNEVAEDLEELQKILLNFGVKVLRPGKDRAEHPVITPHWGAYGKDTYNVRDIHMVVGNTLISSPSPTRFRYFEANTLYPIWYQYFQEGFRWISAPKPKLRGEYLVPYYQNGATPITQEDVLQASLMEGRSEIFHKLLEDEIIFNAASTIRLGRDLIYLVSNTGNHKGAKWLQSILGGEYRVHITTSYRASHIDSTILPLRPGLVLLNAARVNRESCPEILKKWDAIYFNDVAPVPKEELDFQKNIRDVVHKKISTLGINNSLNNISSPWAGLNVLSLDPETVLVHDLQTKLIKELEKKQLTVIPVRMRHCYTMLGGLRCSTLDTVRKSKLESYF